MTGEPEMVIIGDYSRDEWYNTLVAKCLHLGGISSFVFMVLGSIIDRLFVRRKHCMPMATISTTPHYGPRGALLIMVRPRAHSQWRISFHIYYCLCKHNYKVNFPQTCAYASVGGSNAA